MSKKVKFINIVLLLVASCCFGVMLTDVEMYFDPDTIEPDYYPRIILSDLSDANTYVWSDSGVAVIDADILPMLKEGDYPDGYIYSQADYDLIPNVDYTADITAGVLTCTFNAPSLYHVRVVRNNGQQTIYAVFAETGLLEKLNAEKTSKSKKIPTPEGDIFLAENSDKTVDDAVKILENAGREVERINSRQDVVDAIKKKSDQLGRKIHAELVGHGTNGNVSTGAGKKNIASKQVDLSSVEKFQKDIDAYVDELTIQSCKVAKGTDGEKFMKVLADSIGKVGAYDSSLIVVNQTHFALPTTGNWVVKNSLEKAAHNFDPTTADTPLATAITWDYGSDATTYEVYVSTDEVAVTMRDAMALAMTTADNFYYPEMLEMGQTYYYAVDAFGGIEPYMSDVWKFTVQDQVVVDNFDYETTAQLLEAWGPFGELQAGVTGDFRAVGENSVALNYDNFGIDYSGITQLFDAPQNWLEGGGDSLNLWLYSTSISEFDFVAVEITDASSQFVEIPIPAVEIINAGEQGYNWNIPFATLTQIDLSQVERISILIDSSMNVCEPGMCSGTLIVDDIEVVPSQCVVLEADLSGDGVINLDDFRIMASQWLMIGCQ